MLDPSIFFTYMISSRKNARFVLPEDQIVTLLNNMLCVFKNEENMLTIDAPIIICGDIHGQYYDLIRIFELNGYPPLNRYLFLGDYVDRGKYSIETVCLLFVMKMKFPEHVFLLRGNHEDESLNMTYGFYDECKRKYNTKIFKMFTEVFKWLPVAACVSNKILCMHGGLSPNLHHINNINKINRNVPIPDDGLLCDLVWSDPDKNISGFEENEDRGVSFVFGKDVVADFIKKNDLDLVCRAHQVVEDGYEFFANKKLITIFSAPNYDSEFDNSGAMMSVDQNLVCTIKAIVPLVKKEMFKNGKFINEHADRNSQTVD